MDSAPPDEKRFKPDVVIDPSLSSMVSSSPTDTLLVTNVPPMPLHEIVQLFERFGFVVGVVKVCLGSAVLIQYGDVGTSMTMVQKSHATPFFVGQNKTTLYFSSVSLGKPPTSTSDEGPKVLRLHIQNAIYPITVNVVNAICSSHAPLVKILIGNKEADNSVEALCEFKNNADAAKTMEALQGADIYAGCCTLKIAFSQLAYLQVLKNDMYSWDYSPPAPSTQVFQALPTEPGSNGLTASVPPISGPILHHPSVPLMGAVPPPGMQPPPQVMQPPQMMPLMQIPMSGMQPGMPSMQPPPPGMCPIQPGIQPPFAGPPGARGFPLKTSSGANVLILRANLNPDAEKESKVDPTDIVPNEDGQGTVVTVLHCPPHVNCDMLFNLFCMYGNIARIKFLLSKPGMALVQMGTREQADNAILHYNGKLLFGNKMEVVRSKYSAIQSSAATLNLMDGTPSCKEYQSNINNRFLTHSLAAKNKILPPSTKLHFFNCPPNLTFNDVREILVVLGCKPPQKVFVFQTKKPNVKTNNGLVEYSNLGDALTTLAIANHSEIRLGDKPNPYHLKFGFNVVAEQ